MALSVPRTHPLSEWLETRGSRRSIFMCASAWFTLHLHASARRGGRQSQELGCLEGMCLLYQACQKQGKPGTAEGAEVKLCYMPFCVQLLQEVQPDLQRAVTGTGEVRVAAIETLAMGCFVAGGDDDVTIGGQRHVQGTGEEYWSIAAEFGCWVEQVTKLAVVGVARVGAARVFYMVISEHAELKSSNLKHTKPSHARTETGSTALSCLFLSAAACSRAGACCWHVKLPTMMLDLDLNSAVAWNGCTRRNHATASITMGTW
eukprot:scaffold3958_cov14-Tisochrysis_lutea.AAC.1